MGEHEERAPQLESRRSGSVGFEPGRIVIRRYFTLGSMPTVVKYGRVVSDDDRGLLLWVAEGSPLRWEQAVDGRTPRDMPFSEWVAVPKRLDARGWQGSGILVLSPPGAAHSVWWFWRPDVTGWYVNLEQPSVRWDDGHLAGVDTVDQELDIVVARDGSWSWKDAHELAERSLMPEHHWVDDPAAVRAEGERVIKLVEAGAFPFDGSWWDYQPDPTWTNPADLPPGWDRPRAC